MRRLRILFPGILLLATLPPATAKDRHSSAMGDTSELNYRQFALVVVQNHGRQMPVDTFAREALTRLVGKSTYSDTTGRMWWPKDFLLSAMLATHDWKNEPMMVISLGKLRKRLTLPSAQRRFSFAQLSALPEIARLAGEATMLRESGQALDRMQAEVINLNERVSLLARIIDGSAFLIVPPPNQTEPWISPADLSRYYNDEQSAPVRSEIQAVATAYRQADSFQFSRASKRLRDSLRTLNSGIYLPHEQMRLEYFYNNLESFHRAIWLYGAAFVVVLIAYLRRRSGALRNIGIALAAVGLGLHAIGICMRWMVTGELAMIDLCECMVWLSFAATLMAVIVFARARITNCMLVALPVSMMAFLIVHQMPLAVPVSFVALVTLAIWQIRARRPSWSRRAPAEIPAEQVAV